MLAAPFRVVLDANVLFPFMLRDTLLRAAALGLYQVYWSAEILDETIRNLIEKQGMREDQGRHLVQQMDSTFPEAMVTGYEYLVSSMRNDPKDRHVVAAAVAIGAQVIVTNNLRDFQDIPVEIEAQTPDEFLCGLLDLDPDTMVRLLRSQAEALKNPPLSFDQVLRALEKVAPNFVAGVRADANP